MPEYRSNILALSILKSIKFECFKILKIFSFTESFSGLVTEFLQNLAIYLLKNH